MQPQALMGLTQAICSGRQSDPIRSGPSQGTSGQVVYIGASERDSCGSLGATCKGTWASMRLSLSFPDPQIILKRDPALVADGLAPTVFVGHCRHCGEGDLAALLPSLVAHLVLLPDDLTA